MLMRVHPAELDHRKDVCPAVVRIYKIIDCNAGGSSWTLTCQYILIPSHQGGLSQASF